MQVLAGSTAALYEMTSFQLCHLAFLGDLEQPIGCKGEKMGRYTHLTGVGAFVKAIFLLIFVSRKRSVRCDCWTTAMTLEAQNV